MAESSNNPLAMRSKRAFDIFAAGVLLVLLAPVMAIIALLVRLILGSPVLFIQERPGLGGGPFPMVKFRTMTPPAAAIQQTDAERMSAFGRVLRRASLDELPELWNVLRGDMSLVGPRPLLVDYLPLYSPEQKRRHAVRPGMTGLAQISGRNAIGWDQRFALDVWYVDNWSWALDLRIIRQTAVKVFRGRRGVPARSCNDRAFYRVGEMNHLLIVGAGGHGRVVADTALRSGHWSGIVWVDDRMDRSASVLGFPIVGGRLELAALRSQFADAVVAIGDNALRVTVTRELQALGYSCPAVVDPRANVSARSTLGPGTVVFAGAILGVDARTGCACILNHGSTVDHDCVLGDGVHICPGANLAGNVEVGTRAWIGIGSVVIQGVSIGMDAVVGAGAAVLRDVIAGTTVGGVPAAPLNGQGSPPGRR